MATFLFLFCACTAVPETRNEALQNPKLVVDSGIVDERTEKGAEYFEIVPKGESIRSRFLYNDQFWERPFDNSYANWLLDLELFPDGHEVLYYNNEKKQSAGKICVGVLKFDLVGQFDKKGNERSADLQQCADACMRIRAEFLWKHKMYEKIHFNNNLGFTFSYTKWAEGYRVQFDKKWNASWHKVAGRDYGYTNFRKYLSFVFCYCGTLSLYKELVPVKLSGIQPGDVLIWGGSPGHAVTVMDVQRNKHTGKLRVMLSQSYMPAQEIEILANKYDNYSPWFEVGDENMRWFKTPEWNFDLSDGAKFMRWKDL